MLLLSEAPSIHAPTGNHNSDFYSHRLILPVSAFDISEVIQRVHSCVAGFFFFLCNIIMLRLVSVAVCINSLFFFDSGFLFNIPPY